ncbi:MAG: immunoglobulin domain-containing protein, partial [Ferruginibacter sp.]
ATSTALATNLTGIYLGSSITSSLPQVNGNTIQNISHLSTLSSGTFNGINGQNGYIESYQNNTIRNIYAAANSGAGSLIYTGIQTSTSLGPNTIIANNIIDNINYQSSGSAAQLRGMQISGGAPKVTTISGNSISNLTALSQKTSIPDTDDPASFAILGIWFSTGGTSSLITNNNFYNFSSSTTAAINTVVAGLGIVSPGGGNIYRNRMSGFSNSATGSAIVPGIIGIKAFNGAFNVYNNSIKFSNASFTNGVTMYGIVQNSPGTNWTYFHNSVSISGSTPAGNAARTAAFIRTTEGGLVLKNNVFINTRTGTGAHYAISNAVASPSATWSSSSNYNDLYSSNANTIAEWGTGVTNTFAQFQSNSAGEANSVNRAVSFITSPYDLQPDANLTCALSNAGTPITTPVVINTDLNSVARSATVPDLGAYEYTYVARLDTASNDGAKCVGQNSTLGVITGNAVAPYSYSWTGPNSFVSTSQNPVLSSVTALMAGTYTVTATDANGCSVNAQTILTINALPAGTLSSNPGNTVTTGSPVLFTATDGSSYNFKINGNSVQNNATATYTTSSLKTGDIITVTVGNSNGCITTYTGITMSVWGIMVNGKYYIKWNAPKIKKWNGVKKVN